MPGTMNLLTGFGQTLTAGMGNLAFNPSTATPGFEFTITNFSKLLGANPANGVVVMTQDGQINVEHRQGRAGRHLFQRRSSPRRFPNRRPFWSGPAWPVEWRGATAAARGGRPLDARFLAVVGSMNTSLRKAFAPP